jgi:alpha-glucosidase
MSTDTPTEPTTSGISRRTLFKWGGAVAAVGVGGTAIGVVAAKAANRSDARSVGQFLLWIEKGGDAPSIRVAHKSDADRILFESVAGAGFVGAGQATTAIEENTTPASGFTISDVDLKRLDTQTITSIDDTHDAITIHGRLSGAGEPVDYSMRWTTTSDNRLKFVVAISGSTAKSTSRIFLRYASEPDERFFGFGQQLTFVDQKGRLLPILVQEHGVGRGLPILTDLIAAQLGPRSAGNFATTEVSVPQYVTSMQRSIFLENTEYSVFDLRLYDRVEIEVFADTLTGQIVHGTTPLDLIAEYTAYAGRMPCCRTGFTTARSCVPRAALTPFGRSLRLCRRRTCR